MTDRDSDFKQIHYTQTHRDKGKKQTDLRQRHRHWTQMQTLDIDTSTVIRYMYKQKYQTKVETLYRDADVRHKYQRYTFRHRHYKQTLDTDTQISHGHRTEA